MIFIAFFFIVAFSLNENDFNNGQSCICAVIAGACNPYCCCDPNCPEETKRGFSFCLPERLGQAKISCDASGRIDKPNINQIKTVVINNVTCYEIDDSLTGSSSRITNYSPADFGLSNFSEITDAPFNSTFFNNTIENYTVGDFVTVRFLDSPVSRVYFPVGVGSSVCNSMIPLLYGVSTPNYSCRVPTESPFRRSVQWAVQFNIITQRLNKSEVANTQYDGMNIQSEFTDTNTNQVLLNVQYLFQANYTDGSFVYYKPRRNEAPSQAVIANTSNSNFLIFGHQVFFSEDAVDTTGLQEYQIGNMAYYYGVPIMVASENIQTSIYDSVLNRQPLKINSDNVLFGVNSSYVVNLTDLINHNKEAQNTCPFANNDNATCFDGADFYDGVLNNSAAANLSFASIRNQLYPTAFSSLYNQYTKARIFNTYGNVLNVIYAEHTFQTNNNRSNPNTWIFDKDIKYPTAQWTFYYKRFNTKETPLYVLMQYDVRIAFPDPIPVNASELNKQYNTIGVINTAFIEITDGFLFYEPEETKPYTGTLSMVFDTFFTQNSDALKTIAIFFCFALLGTIWCWYMCFFHIE